MTIEAWVNLAIATVPTAALLIFRLGSRDQKLEAVREDLAEFREESRKSARDLTQEFRGSQDRLSQLEHRATKLEEFRHHANNRLLVLSGHVDELRIKKN